MDQLRSNLTTIITNFNKSGGSYKRLFHDLDLICSVDTEVKSEGVLIVHKYYTMVVVGIPAGIDYYFVAIDGKFLKLKHMIYKNEFYECRGGKLPDDGLDGIDTDLYSFNESIPKIKHVTPDWLLN